MVEHFSQRDNSMKQVRMALEMSRRAMPIDESSQLLAQLEQSDDFRPEVDGTLAEALRNAQRKSVVLRNKIALAKAPGGEKTCV